MKALVLEGKAASEATYEELTERLARLKLRGVTAGLAVAVLGSDPASLAYVRSKSKMCQRLGIHSVLKELPENTTQQELLELIHRWNVDPQIHGILVQSPTPPHIHESEVVHAIDPDKDVDGFHPTNVARLALGEEGFVPCTPLGCVKLLQHYGISVSGRRVVILGRSLIVGKSLALLLMQRGEGRDATVTVAHSATHDLPSVCHQAEILVAAIGRPHFVTKDHVPVGCVVVDVGINRVEDPSSAKGYRLVGDVDFEAVAPFCRAITPVPGGVGPMTIAMLMNNTVTSAERRLG
ncbi:MAG: bifunctional methylenetetrahydrofolate dehydrogenase/methenyltetrahydrofolate cyclohydrolase FolD [Verrucomicrobiales bacterium]